MSRCALPGRFASLLRIIVSLFVFFSVSFTPATVAAQDLKTVVLPHELERIRAEIERYVREEKREARGRVIQVGEKAANPPVDSADSLALVALYNSTAGASWKNNINWLTKPVSMWFGITVEGDRVTEIRLPGNKLEGTIPEKIGDLTALTELNLGIDLFGGGENKLRGSIPSELGNLSELTQLWLDGNELTGSIPSSLGNLTNLESLDFGNFFGGNMLTGSIPSSFGDLTSLEVLRLANNELSGSIPASVGNLSTLVLLDLSGNMLTGSIPSVLGNLANLAYLDLGNVFGGNQLTGTIPASLGSLQNVVFLSMDRNQLEGTIPPSLGQMLMLESLSLMGNRLSGSIPPELGNLPNIGSLNLGMDTIVADDDGNFIPISLSNLLSGEIPSQLGNLTKLGSLLLSNNAFSGAVPSSFANLNLLLTLMLNCNQLEDLPSLSTSPGLSALFIQKNRFTFEDIEPNIGLASVSFTYSPQAAVSVTISPAGLNLVLSVAEAGPNDQYQWFLNETPIAGANEFSHVIAASDPNGVTAYHVEITNSVAVDLSLSSLPTYSNIVVNDAGDAPDAQLADGICDTDLQTPGSQCTLRAALQILAQGNSLTCGTDAVQIKFEGVQIIRPNSRLPTITKSVLINGDIGGSRVEIKGGLAGQSHGFDIEGQDVTLRSLKINNFNGWGVRINGGSGHVIEDSRIGVLSEEMTNAAGGVLVEGDASDVRIGGLLVSQENVIGGGIRVDGEGTKEVRILRNTLEMPGTWMSSRPLRVPVDMSGDGPTCRPWDGEDDTKPNRGIPPPKIFELKADTVKGIARPGATVIAYLVTDIGSDAGRYWPRTVVPIGSAQADGTGLFEVIFDFTLSGGSRVTVSMVDASGNTSELSQIRRPVIYLPGVGGSWLEAENGDNLFLPTDISGASRDRRLSRLSMNEAGTESLTGEQVHVDGILEEFGLPYRAVLQHLQNAGFIGKIGNSDERTLDLWRFPYDWRRDPSIIADDLEILVDRITNNMPTDEVAASCEVDIVTHSNGGMVASAYVWKNRKQGLPHSRDHVNRLLMSAAPYWGAPQVLAAHTRGYLFDIEKIPFVSEQIDTNFNWGVLTAVFLNLPDGYALLPSKKYVEQINSNAPFQRDYFLTDLLGNPLRDHASAVAFMEAPKLDPLPGALIGLGRNGAMWTQQQINVHKLIDDWRTYDGPPQVFRHIGR
ncbi:MAG: hypothetical protein O7C39_00430, partial [Bacteroidetes bacterium]|nr:hypothetical protein [Bacteroidota bacterium]